MLNIRLFKAIDDLESCIKFAEGHAKVLLDYGVTKVTSSSTDWFYNPSVYVIIAEIAETKETVGGIRVHIADGITPLPMEDAISIVDKKVYQLIKDHTQNGTAELCGLWNSKTTSGWGIGSYILMRAGISIIPKLNLATLFALCAPHTLNISVQKGFEIEKSIGNQGTFIYPKLDLIATSIIVKNPVSLPLALPNEKKIIINLRENPLNTIIESSPKKIVEVNYNLCLPLLHSNIV